ASQVGLGRLEFAVWGGRTPTGVPVREAVRPAVALGGDRLRSPAVETIKAFDGSDPVVFGDRDELTQVFINLITNAADAMPRGGRLTLSTDVRRHEDVAYLSARVTDTGVGIPPENRDKIFEPFFTPQPEAQGTGLGLA